jgi:hypothetical protein
MPQKPLSFMMLSALQQGKSRLDDEAQRRIASFVSSQLTANGGFMDKSGKADLYYTSFGLMLAYILKLNINTSIIEKWLDKQENQLSDLVYGSAYIRSRMLCKLLKANKLNFALTQLFKTKQTLPVFTDYPHDDMYSPYSQFLLLSLHEDMGIKTINQQEILTSISEYHIEAGGYSNIKGSSQATTNATVAALAVKGQLYGYLANDDIRYLYLSQDESGGFFAGVSSPVPDLLSTATALFMLKCYGLTPRFNADDFIDSHWLSSGSFGATLMDETGDVEYTFYGLLALGV